MPIHGGGKCSAAPGITLYCGAGSGVVHIHVWNVSCVVENIGEQTSICVQLQKIMWRNIVSTPCNRRSSLRRVLQVTTRPTAFTHEAQRMTTSDDFM